MIENCLLFHENPPNEFSDWQKLSPINLEFTKLADATDEFLDKKIDEAIASIAIISNDYSNKALALIGIYLNLDAATLLGNSSAGNDRTWIASCNEIRDQIANLKIYKNDKKRLVQALGLTHSQELFKILEKSLSRKTKTFLVSEIAVALAFLLARENSKAKEYLIPAIELNSPGMKRAIDSAGFNALPVAQNTDKAKSLALALLSHM